MSVLLLGLFGAIVGSVVGPPLLGGSVGLIVGGASGLARRPSGDGEVLRVLGICVAVFGAASAGILDHVSHLHVCLQPWRLVVFDWLAFDGKTHRCLTWWTTVKTVVVCFDAVSLGALLLVQGRRASTDEAERIAWS